MKWDIEEKTLNDVVEVFADPGVSTTEACLAQRIKVRAPGSKPAQHRLQQPGRLEFAPSRLRVHQPCEVQTRHQETGAASEHCQHWRLQPTDAKQADRREERHRDVRQRVARDPRFGESPAMVRRQSLYERASVATLWRTAAESEAEAQDCQREATGGYDIHRIPCSPSLRISRAPGR